MHVNAQILLYCLKHLSRAGNKAKERKEKKIGGFTYSNYNWNPHYMFWTRMTVWFLPNLIWFSLGKWLLSCDEECVKFQTTRLFIGTAMDVLNDPNFYNVFDIGFPLLWSSELWRQKMENVLRSEVESDLSRNRFHDLLSSFQLCLVAQHNLLCHMH